MSTVRVLSGNDSCALAAKMARPDVVAAYPITPQTPIVEALSQFVADGELDAELCEVESEHSALSVLHGAALGGGRTFTATSSQGLALMYEPYFRTSGLRLPIVMAIANREMISPQSVWGGPQDALTVRDAGWIQFYMEDNQEIFDSVLQAFRLAEDPRVLLPVNVCYDGFYLSHMSERVEVPEQEEVDAFLPKRRLEHILLDPQQPMSVDPLTPGAFLTEYRRKHVQAMEMVPSVLREINTVYRELTGRAYGATESYRLDDAELVLVTMGSMTGAAREAVDRERERGLRVGLLKVRMFRPFPREEVATALHGKAGFAVVDRSVAFGWGTGILYPEVRAVAFDLPRRVPAVPFVGGLGGEDLTVELMQKAIRILALCVERGKSPARAVWLTETA